MKKIIFILLIAPFFSFAQERARVDINTGEILEFNEPKTAVQSRWLPVTRLPQPNYNANLKRLEKVITVSETGVEISWIRVDLTQQEIDDRTAANETDTEKQTRNGQLRGIMRKLRLGTATDAEVKTALWRLLRQFDFEEE